MKYYVVSVQKHKQQAACERIERRFLDLKTCVNDVFEKSPYGLARGCYESHLKILEHFVYETNEKHAVIFEDDVTFRDTSFYFPSIQQYINIFPESFELIYFGHRLVTQQICSFEKLSKHIMRVKTNDTHAYCISRLFATTVTSLYSEYSGVPIDVLFRRIVRESFAVYPMIAVQQGISRIHEVILEKMVVFGIFLSSLYWRVWALLLLFLICKKINA